MIRVAFLDFTKVEAENKFIVSTLVASSDGDVQVGSSCVAYTHKWNSPCIIDGATVAKYGMLQQSRIDIMEADGGRILRTIPVGIEYGQIMYMSDDGAIFIHHDKGVYYIANGGLRAKVDTVTPLLTGCRDYYDNSFVHTHICTGRYVAIWKDEKYVGRLQHNDMGTCLVNVPMVSAGNTLAFVGDDNEVTVHDMRTLLAPECGVRRAYRGFDHTGIRTAKMFSDSVFMVASDTEIFVYDMRNTATYNIGITLPTPELYIGYPSAAFMG